MSTEKLLNFPLCDLDARVAMADPKALAYKWIQGYAENINSRIADYYRDEDGASARYEFYDAAALIDIGMGHIDGKWGDYISHGGTFEGESSDPMFWEKLSIILEREVDGGSFFSCSC